MPYFKGNQLPNRISVTVCTVCFPFCEVLEVEFLRTPDLTSSGALEKLTLSRHFACGEFVGRYWSMILLVVLILY